MELSIPKRIVGGRFFLILHACIFFIAEIAISFTLNKKKIHSFKSYSKWKTNNILFRKAKRPPNRNQTLTIDFADVNEVNLQNQTWREIYAHERLMDVALQQARQAGEFGEVPIGAMIVLENDIINNSIEKDESIAHRKDGKRSFTILSQGQNQIETIHDASAHAELQAMRSASQNIQNWRLLNTTLYSTLEPCPMCLSAAQAFRVSKVVYGAPDLRLGAVETHIKLLDVATHPFHDTMEVVGGIKSQECGQLLIDFFRERRKQKKKAKKSGIVNEQQENTDVDNASTTKSNFPKRLLKRLLKPLFQTEVIR